MQSSSSPGQHQKAGSVRSPQRSQTVDTGSTTSPRSAPIRLTPRSPDSHPELSAALRMFDFYAIDRQFDSLKDEAQSASKAGRSSALPAIIDELQINIRQSVLDAEKKFKCGASDECRLYLTAAKSNQVALLGKIDDIPDSAMAAEKRTALRATCVALGKTLTRMLLQATTKAAAATAERERKRAARYGDEHESPPGSPTTQDEAPKIDGNTPTRDSKKRTQGNADSPVLAETSPKRQKRSAISSTSSSATTASMTSATTTSTTASGLSSPPQYREVPLLERHQEVSGRGPDRPATAGDDVAPGSPTSTSSPRKSRALSPQPKPRPRSQLFTAPPDFSSQSADNMSPRKLATAAPLPLPGVTGGVASDARPAIKDGSGEQL